MKLPDGNDLRHYGRYLVDGEISIKPNDEDAKNMFAFVFEKIVILTEGSKLGKNGLFAFVNAINLCDYQVEMPFGANTLSRKNHLALLLTCRKYSMVYTLFLENETMRNMWLKVLENAM